MPINHSFKLLMCNIKLVLKLSLLIIIIGLVIFALISSAITPFIKSILDIFKDTQFNADDLINHPVITLRSTLFNGLEQYLQSSDWSTTVVYLVLLLFVLRFLVTLPKLPVTKVLYNKMISGYDIGLFSAFISTGFQNLLLSLILSILTFAINVGLIIGFGSLILLCIESNLMVFVPFVIILYIAALSARASLLSQWLPEICASQTKNIFKEVVSSVKSSIKRFPKNFLCYLTINIISFSVVTSTALLSFGAIPLICIPVYLVLSCTLSLTLNFSYKGQKYFMDNGVTIYTPTKMF